tara:strand:- start:62 stop:430 length:369 start_codon:yes stop_codon:yes gene_type:complete
MKKKVLIVDDSLTIRSSLQRYFEESYQVNLAENGQECIHLLEKDQSYDLLILDVNMPIMGGIEVVHNIAKNENIKEIKTIMLTTETNQEKKNELYQYKFVKCWIIKPITEDLILAAASKVLE